MSEEHEYDYYGVPITTHTREECTETMQRDVLIGDLYYDDTPIPERVKGGTPGDQTWLSERDREVLMEYAPKLFSTLPADQDLSSAMNGLAEIVGKHRFENVYRKSEQNKFNEHALSQKSNEEKAKSLQSHIEAIVKIIGTDMYVPKDSKLAQFRTPHDDLLDELEGAYQDPMRYLPHRPPEYCLEQDEHGETIKLLHHTLTPTKDYLKSLRLKKRSIEITSFITELKSQDWFSTFMRPQQGFRPL